MSETYQEIHLQLTTHRDSPPITREEKDALLAFCREELESSGEYELHTFEDYLND